MCYDEQMILRQETEAVFTCKDVSLVLTLHWAYKTYKVKNIYNPPQYEFIVIQVQSN